MLKPYYIKGVHRVKKKKQTKKQKKTPVLESLFNKVAGIKRVHHKCFPMKFFLITPQNQTTFQRKQISRVT